MAENTTDLLGRPLRDLRISLTDRCNLRCTYCMPRETFGPGFEFMPSADQLSFSDIARLVKAFAAHGVRKIRLTGGEPLLRRDVPRLVAALSQIDGIDDVALTTNGVLLDRNAHALKDAGLGRVTVSLDSVDPEVFAAISDSTAPIAAVLEGIDAAKRVGLPTKINMVIRRGVNEQSVVPMAEHFRGTTTVLRFIEFMDVGETNGWNAGQVVPASELLRAIADRWPVERLAPTVTGEVASRYRYLDGAGEIGFVHSVSEPFCSTCNRARLSADGRLYTCLFADTGHDLRPLLRDDVDDAGLALALGAVWARRSDRYSAERRAPSGRELRPNSAGQKIEMSYIGG